jgi:hypothetical protein
MHDIMVLLVVSTPTTNQVAHEACDLHIRHIAGLLRGHDMIPKVVFFRLSAFLCK